MGVITALNFISYFGMISVGLGAVVLLASKYVKRHVKFLMGLHLITNFLLLLSFNLLSSETQRLSCYVLSLFSFLGFVLSYSSAVVLSIFNCAAVFYPHVFYNREMLVPAGLATLASWTVGLAVSVLAVGFKSYNIPTGTDCTPIPLMPRYGVVTLASVCLLCTCVVVGINMKLVQYFRKSRFHSNASVNQKASPPQLANDAAAKDRKNFETGSRPKTISVQIRKKSWTPCRCDNENEAVLKESRRPGMARMNGDVRQDMSVKARRGGSLGVHVIDVEPQTVAPASPLVYNTSKDFWSKTHDKSNSSCSRDIQPIVVDVDEPAVWVNKDIESSRFSQNIQGTEQTKEKKNDSFVQSQINRPPRDRFENCFSPQSQDNVQTSKSCRCFPAPQENREELYLSEVTYNKLSPILFVNHVASFCSGSNAIPLGFADECKPEVPSKLGRNHGRFSPQGKPEKQPLNKNKSCSSSQIKTTENLIKENKGSCPSHSRTSLQPLGKLGSSSHSQGQATWQPLGKLGSCSHSQGQATWQPLGKLGSSSHSQGQTTLRPLGKLGSSSHSQGQATWQPLGKLGSSSHLQSQATWQPLGKLGSSSHSQGQTTLRPLAKLGSSSHSQSQATWQPLGKLGSSSPSQGQATWQPLGKLGSSSPPQGQTALEPLGKPGNSSPPQGQTALEPLGKPGSSSPPQRQATLQPKRRNKTILVTLVILTLWTCCMNLPLTLYLFMSGSLDTTQAKREFLQSLIGSIAIFLIVIQSVLNPYLYLFRLIGMKDMKRTSSRIVNMCKR